MHLTRGARLKVRVSKGMQLRLGTVYDEERLWVSVSVTNIGDQPTTITSFGCVIYASRLEQWRSKSEFRFVFNGHEVAAPLPILLSSGENWNPLVPQSDADMDLSDKSQEMIVMMEIKASHKTKPIRVRLK